MAIFRNSAEGGTDGTTVTVANSGGDSGDAWDAPHNLNSGDIEFDTAQFSHGAMSYLVQPATSVISEFRKSVTASGTVLCSMYFRTPSIFAATATLIQIRHASATAARLQLTNGAKFRTQNLTDATVSTAVSNALVDTWYRLELRAVRGTSSSNGTIQFAYYLLDNTTAVETFSSTTTNTGDATTGDFTNVRYGRCSSAPADTTNFWMDSIQTATDTEAAAMPLVWPAPLSPSGTGGPLVWDGADWI